MLLLNILLLLSVGLAIAHPDYSDSWQEFKQKHNKQYDSEEEEVAYNYIDSNFNIKIICLSGLPPVSLGLNSSDDL